LVPFQSTNLKFIGLRMTKGIGIVADHHAHQRLIVGKIGSINEL